MQQHYTAHFPTYPVAASTSYDTSLPVSVIDDDTTLLFGLPNLDFTASSEPDLETAIEAYAVETAEAEFDAGFEQEIDEQATAAANAQLEAEALAFAEAQIDAEATAAAEAQLDAEATAAAEAQLDAEATAAAEAQVDVEATAAAEAQIDAEATAAAEAQLDAEAAQEFDNLLNVALEDAEELHSASQAIIFSPAAIPALIAAAVCVEPGHLTALKRIRESDKSVPHHPLPECHDRYIEISSLACTEFGGEAVDNSTGEARHLTSFQHKTNVNMSWRPTSDYPGPIMNPRNKASTVMIARELGINGDTMSVVDVSYRSYDPSYTGKSPMQKLEPEKMQSFLIGQVRYEAKVQLSLRNCCVFNLGNDVHHYWDKAISNEPIPFIEDVEPYLQKIYGSLYDELRDVEIVRSTYSIEMPVTGLAHPERRSFDMLRLANQEPEDSSIICPGYSLIYLQKGGIEAGFDILLSTAIFHAANGTKLPDLKHLLPDGPVNRTLALIMRNSRWAAAEPRPLSELIGEHPTAAMFTKQCLASPRLRPFVERQLAIKWDEARDWLEQVLQIAEERGLYLPKLLQQCWMLKAADTRQRRKDGLLTEEELRVLDVRNVRARQYYKDNREKILAYNRQYYKDNREKILAYARQYYKDNREKILAHKRQYYKDNREKILAYARQYYKDNRDKILAYQRQWKLENHEKIQAYAHQYYKDNRKKITAYARQYYRDNREKLLAHHLQYYQANHLAMKERKRHLKAAAREGRKLPRLPYGSLAKREAELQAHLKAAGPNTKTAKRKRGPVELQPQLRAASNANATDQAELTAVGAAPRTRGTKGRQGPVSILKTKAGAKRKRVSFATEVAQSPTALVDDVHPGPTSASTLHSSYTPYGYQNVPALAPNPSFNGMGGMPVYSSSALKAMASAAAAATVASGMPICPPHVIEAMAAAASATVFNSMPTYPPHVIEAMAAAAAATVFGQPMPRQ